MSQIIEKKVWPDYFEKILSGEKNFELRLADFECEPGDTLVLKEFDPKSNEYTGRTLEKKVTYVLKTEDVDFWPKEKVDEHGLVVISFK